MGVAKRNCHQCVINDVLIRWRFNDHHVVARIHLNFSSFKINKNNGSIKKFMSGKFRNHVTQRVDFDRHAI